MSPTRFDAGSDVRLRLDISYDGSDFSGWADQPGRRTVQGTLEAAIATVCRVPAAHLTVAGRTDAGVHARGQVAHVDLPAAALEQLPPQRLVRRLARLLPDDVRVRAATAAPPGFDARFSASWRRYAYRICDDSASADPLLRRHVLTWPRPLDVDEMNAAAAGLLGEHDFAAFCRKRLGATTIRTLHEFTWRRGTRGIAARIVADAFCHNMVRSMVGALVVVGEGRQSVGWVTEVLGGRVRDPRVPVVGPVGLTLEEVGYPADGDLARQAEATRRLRTLPEPDPAEVEA